MHYQRTLVKGCNWSSKSEGGGVCDCASLANFQMRLSILVWVPRSQYLLCFGMSCMCAKALQLYLTLCNPMDCSPPGSFIHRILQARILEWVAISFSRGSSWPRNRTRVSHTGGRRFNLWATREAHIPHIILKFKWDNEINWLPQCYNAWISPLAIFFPTLPCMKSDSFTQLLSDLFPWVYLF